MSEINIIKAGGESELWNREKLERSLKSAGASNELAVQIIAHVEKDLHDGMSTSDIFQHAFRLLRKEYRPYAAQYSLRRALLQLGPTGFPFERFVAHILQKEGYTTTVGVMVPGMCVTHEVDVIAEKPDERIIVEAKYHNDTGIKTDVKVALYVHARYLDVMKHFEIEDKNDKQRYQRPWLITNTNFSSQAITYGTCVGLNMTGWNFPKGRTLQDIVQETQSHPITCLTTLTGLQKQQLLTRGMVICQEILRDPEILGTIGVPKSRRNSILQEVKALSNI